MKIKNTSDIGAGSVKLLVYGQAGAGKTCLIPTLPNCIVLSAEGGLLSIQGSNLPFIEIKGAEDLREAYRWLTKSQEAEGFDAVAIDSISEIAELILAGELDGKKDGRQAYGEMNRQMIAIIRSFRDLPKTIYMTAKLDKVADETGKVLYSPSMPGKTLTQELPYFFDEVLALRIEKTADGESRVLQCQSDGSWLAKDRSGKLSFFETPDLGEIISKIQN